MEATFKPTSFKFKMDDRYFVQIQLHEKASDGFDVCEVVGVFQHLTDAKAFAQWRLNESSRVFAKAVHVFSRDAQIETYRKQAVAA